jgi:hypothetical protein
MAKKKESKASPVHKKQKTPVVISEDEDLDQEEDQEEGEPMETGDEEQEENLKSKPKTKSKPQKKEAKGMCAYSTHQTHTQPQPTYYFDVGFNRFWCPLWSICAVFSV